MAETRLKASLIIGGLIDSSFRTVLTDTKRSFRVLDQTVKSLQTSQRDLNVQMDALRNTGETLKPLTQRYEALGKAIKQAETATKNLRQAEAFKGRMDRAGEQSRYLAGRATVGAIGGGLFMRNLLQESGKFQTENARLSIMGVPDKAKQQALAAGQSLKIFGSTIRESIETYNDGLAVFGSMKEARIAAPLMAKMKFANNSLYGVSEEESERQQKNMLRVIDIRGGANDAGEFTKQSDYIQKAYIASKGLVTGSEFFKMVSHGGTAVKGMSNDALYFKLLPLIQEMHGDQLGTALQTSYNGLIQGHTSKRAAINLMEAGLIADKSKVKFDRAGQIAQLNPGALKGASLYIRDPTEWVRTIMLPQLVQAGKINQQTMTDALAGKLTDAERQNLTTAIGALGNSNTGKLLSTIAMSLPQIARDSLNASRSAGIDGSVKAARNTSRGQEIGLHAQLTNLRLNLGTTILPTYISLLKTANRTLDRFNNFIKANPHLTRTMMIGAVAVTGALAASVPILITAGAAMSLYGNLTVIAARRQALMEAAQIKTMQATLMETQLEKTAALTRIGGWKRVGNTSKNVLKNFGIHVATSMKRLKRHPFWVLRNAAVRTFRTIGKLGVWCFRGIGAAMSLLFSPATALVAAMAVGALIVWKYWRPIRAFFQGFGRGLTEAFAPAKPLFASLGKTISTAAGWFHHLLTPIHDTGKGFQGAMKAGIVFGHVVGGVIEFVIDKIGWLISKLATAFGWMKKGLAYTKHFLFTPPQKKNPLPYGQKENSLTFHQAMSENFKANTQAGFAISQTIGDAINPLFEKMSKTPLWTDNSKPYTELPHFRPPEQAATQKGGDTYHFTYSITQQPGQSGEDMARAIMAQQKQTLRKAPAFADGPDGMM
ncbi:hypothetical protein PT277_01485 [Acetobacteraceae bacterium ESL0709]|nr:hypothetical protein [Acetobacteraceae bacterium ESL0697]MDF7677373.1 hypothetical protein [Acetobacteraceae bacterium ESL0709]